MPVQMDVLLPNIQRDTAGNTYLPFYDVYTADFFRNGVFHLQTCIHFDKIKLAVRRKQKFNSSGIGVFCRLCCFDCRVHHLLPDLLRHHRAERFLQYLLLVQLERTVTLPKAEDIPEAVCKYLHFHMPHRCQIFFQKNVPIAERAFRLA